MNSIVRKILVKSGSGGYPVFIGSVGSGPSDWLSKGLSQLLGKEKKQVYVLTSPEIWSLWGERLLSHLRGRSRKRGESAEPVVLFLPAGERHKRLSEVERLASELAGAGADRSSLLIAFGGGVVGDVGGFLAAIYMRGIEYVQIPTTLLAQVDSSVGGKTGVNLRAGKNLIGCFYPPRAVFAGIDFLGTLSVRELRAGLYESIKTGLIRDASLFRFIEGNSKRIDGRDPAALEKIVAASIRVKAEVVSLDERESGLRMILNFGHTVGHAIEAAGGFGAMLHGEAIAWGMLVALKISSIRKCLKPEEAARAEKVIRSFDPPALPPIEPRRLLDAAAKDKKNRAGARRFVLLKGIGKAFVTEDVTDREVRAALDSILQPAQRPALR